MHCSCVGFPLTPAFACFWASVCVAAPAVAAKRAISANVMSFFIFFPPQSAVFAQAAACRPAIDPNTAFAVCGFSPRSPDAAHSPTA